LEIIETGIKGLKVICPRVFADERGYFFEAYNDKVYKAAGVNFNFVQDNISRSRRNTIRGLHFQTGEMAQGKLCHVIYGKVLDVAVDIRIGSPTFGQYYSVELSEENHKQMWMEPGFAHGFSVLSEEVIFSYKCTKLYSKAHESSIRYNDPELAIDWKVTEPVVSERDLNAPLFQEYKELWQKV
jgi:dTDP-4-dehydrorhamnose 3,5-epimerase